MFGRELLFNCAYAYKMLEEMLKMKPMFQLIHELFISYELWSKNILKKCHIDWHYFDQNLISVWLLRSLELALKTQWHLTSTELNSPLSITLPLPLSTSLRIWDTVMWTLYMHYTNFFVEWLLIRFLILCVICHFPYIHSGSYWYF